jgi:virulence-associated protein VagC
MKPRILKSGTAPAARIPKQLVFADATLEVEIERKGDSLAIHSMKKQNLGGATKAFAAFPAGFMAGRRDVSEQKPREWEKKRR